MLSHFCLINLISFSDTFIHLLTGVTNEDVGDSCFNSLGVPNSPLTTTVGMILLLGRCRWTHYKCWLRFHGVFDESCPQNDLSFICVIWLMRRVRVGLSGFHSVGILTVVSNFVPCIRTLFSVYLLLCRCCLLINTVINLMDELVIQAAINCGSSGLDVLVRAFTIGGPTYHHQWNVLHNMLRNPK